jgi:hypothetical protein
LDDKGNAELVGGPLNKGISDSLINFLLDDDEDE